MQGDLEKEFEGAYIEFSEAIFRFCYFRVHDRDKAKEIMQDTFTRTWQYIAKGNDIDDLRPFLYKVARNLCINSSKRDKVDLSLDSFVEQFGIDIEDEYNSNSENASEGRMLLQFMEELDEDFKDLLIMRYVDDMSIKEIAKILGISTNNATVKIHRATKKLRELYDKKK